MEMGLDRDKQVDPGVGAGQRGRVGQHAGFSVCLTLVKRPWKPASASQECKGLCHFHSTPINMMQESGF